mmetsp:Transcript_33824/g.74216  ORF Transcript_33824/g.74216 Transcript_33824/m.74216 type:complete len:257 (-) Transcript_33824:301-1071(-)
MLEHLGDAGDVGGHDRDGAHHRLGNHHRRHLVERGEEEDVGDAVELVDVARHVVDLDARVAVSLRLDLLHVFNLVLALVPGADDDETDILAVAGKLLEDLDGPMLILPRADDSEREEGDRALPCRHGADLPVGRGLGHADKGDDAVLGAVELTLRGADTDDSRARRERLLDNLRRGVLVVALLELFDHHVLRPPLVQHPRGRDAHLGQRVDQVCGHDGVADGEANVAHALHQVGQFANANGGAEISELLRERSDSG